jgi:hypothetical protein
VPTAGHARGDAAGRGGGGPADRAVRLVAVEELPRLANGKPDLQAVADLAAPPAVPRAEAGAGDLDALCALFAEVLDRPVTPDDTFVGLGGDSLSYVEASLRLEQALGALPPDWHVTPLRSRKPPNHHPACPRFGAKARRRCSQCPSCATQSARSPWGFALVLLAAGIASRFSPGWLPTGPDRVHTAHVVFWLFALGWAAARANSVPRRVLLSAVLLTTVPGFFADDRRSALVVVGLLALLGRRGRAGASSQVWSSSTPAGSIAT